MTFLRLVVVGLLAFASAPALGAEIGWGGLVPGTSTKDDVLEKLGEPSRTINVKGAEVLSYVGSQAARGTRQLQFQIQAKTKRVTRIFVFPNTVIDRAGIETTYGPECGRSEGTAQACYVSKLTRDLRAYLAYEAIGLSVFLKPDGKSVFNLAFTEPPAGALTAQPNVKTGDAGQPGGPIPESPALPPGAEAMVDALSPGSGTVSSAGSGLDEPLFANPLKVGGLLYVRSIYQGQNDWRNIGSSFVAPSLLDAFLDAHPHDRLRALAQVRVLYDAGIGLPTLALGNGFQPTDGPQIAVDQVWVKFDLKRTVFVTVGRQHIKWGPGKFWNPTDFLQSPRDNPLIPFDNRLGRNLLKFHLPVESLGWNFYGIAMADAGALDASRLQPGVALRAETVLGPAEVSLTMTAQQGLRPRYGLDVSSGLGPFDIYGEIASDRGHLTPSWRWRGPDAAALPLPQQFERLDQPRNYVASAGLLLPLEFRRSAFTVGVEGYHNPFGYDDRQVLPWLILQNNYLAFRSGKSYGAAYVSWQDTESLAAPALSLTAIANLGDGSSLLRFDASRRLFTELQLELFAAVPMGSRGGEFRFTADIAPDEEAGIRGLSVPLPLFEFGLAVRIGL